MKHGKTLKDIFFDFEKNTYSTKHIRELCCLVAFPR